MRSLSGWFLSLRILGSQKSEIASKVTSYYSIQNDIGYVWVLPELIESVRNGQNGYIYKGLVKNWENMSFSHIAKKGRGHRKKGGSKKGAPFFFVEDRFESIYGHSKAFEKKFFENIFLNMRCCTAATLQANR